MNILLTGATGFIGNAVLRDLLRDEHKIRACCRYPARLPIAAPGIEPLCVDFNAGTTEEYWLPYVAGMDAIVNCVGIIAESAGETFTPLHNQAPTALFKAGAQAGVKKIVQISALGADQQASSAYHLSKKAADDTLRSLALDWFVLQPSIVYGDGAQSSGLFHALAALPVHLLPDGGRQLLQPIHLDDVAAAVCRCLNPTVTGQKTVALVGPSPIAYAELLQKLRYRLGKPPAPGWPVSCRFAEAAATLGKWLGEPIFSKENLSMLNRGNNADPGPITELLGRPPHSMASRLFEKPANQAERWHASLYFLKPLLCLSIACVWLWSGITSLLFYPRELSYRLLADTGITGIAAPLTLYGLSATDILLGLATLARFRPRELMLWQFSLVLCYSLAVAICLPEFVFHPFGPLLKNLPFLICLLIYSQLEGEQP